MVRHARLEAYRDSVQVCPARCEQQPQKNSLHTLDRQALPHNVSCCAQNAAQRALLVLIEIRGGSMVVLEACNVLLQAVANHSTCR